MNIDQQHHRELEETLQALDHLPPIPTDPFLVARIEAEITAGDRRIVRWSPFALPAALAVLLLINIITAVTQVTATADRSQSRHTALVTALQQEDEAAAGSDVLSDGE